MAQPPSRASLLNPSQSTYTDDPDEIVYNRLQDAITQTRRQPRAQYPSMVDVALDHPGMLNYQIMGGTEFDSRQRYNDLLDRLADIQNQSPDAFNRSLGARILTGSGQDGDIVIPPTGPVKPYVERGYMAQGQPLANANDMMLIPFSAVANVATGLLAPRRPGQPDPLDESVRRGPQQRNKATFGLASLFPGAPKTEWSLEDEYADSIPFDDPRMTMTGGNPRSTYKAGETGTMDGMQVLDALGVEDGIGRTVGGFMLEAPLDPFTTGLKPIASGLRGLFTAAGKTGGRNALARQAATARTSLGQISSGLAEEAYFPVAAGMALNSDPATLRDPFGMVGNSRAIEAERLAAQQRREAARLAWSGN